MPDLDDERLEAYLKGFRPLVPDALPAREPRRRVRPLILATAVLGVVATLIFGIVTFRILNHHPPAGPEHFALLETGVPAHPLTLREADALLETAPSYKSAMDELAFPRQRSAVSKENQSALAVLAKEKIKL